MRKVRRNAIYSHVWKKARQRYDIQLNNADQRAIANMIANGETLGIRLRNNVFYTIHIVGYAGVNLPVVYNTVQKIIHTVLPWDHKIVLENFGDIRNGELFYVTPTGRENVIDQPI